MPFEFHYHLQQAGWATACIRDGDSSFDITVSYLHDTLSELADASIAIRDGADSARVVFMDEPGEVHLLIQTSAGDDLSYELRWFDDWNSWGMFPDNQFTTIHRGETSQASFLAEITRELLSLFEEHGEDGYREKWIEHDFPLRQLNMLTSG